jgi:uncharacterized protein
MPTPEQNKETIRRINRGFETGDDAAILACLCDDVRWDVPGAFTASGKAEFAKNIRNENFTNRPVIRHINEIAEGDYVAVEGEVESEMVSGAVFRAFFHNTYFFENGRVKKMTSYLVPKA